MDKLARNRYCLIALVAEFAYMALELCASRLLSPSFGTTLDVWACIIGTILASSSVGNWLAGRLDGRVPAWVVVTVALAGCAATFGIAPVVTDVVSSSVVACGIRRTAGALVTCACVLVVPGVLFGTLPPTLAACHVAADRDDEGASSVSGFWAASTLGGLAGTFATALWLLPALGTGRLLLAMACVLIVLCLVSLVAFGEARHVMCDCVSGASVVAIACCVAIVTGYAWVTMPGSSGGTDVWLDTLYGRAHVTDNVVDGSRVRMLEVSGGHESAVYTEPGREDELVFAYTNAMARVTDAVVDEGSSVLMLGGGAYTMPAWLVREVGCHVDVMEIDEGVTQVARDWFGLDDVVASAPNGMGLLTGDARVLLQESDDTWDVICNDTFAGNEPARSLVTVEAARVVHDHLEEGGLYVCNVLGRTDLDANETFLGREMATLRQSFGLVKAFEVRTGARPEDPRNVIVVATDDLSWKAPGGMQEVEVGDLSDVRVLTDDDAPVEQLTASLFEDS